MTGIDRLRAIAGAWDEWGLGGALAEMADQIERVRVEDCYRMGFDYGTVWRVVTDMERHCLGHEGMEDSPVARWARELREALGALHAPGFQKSRKVANSLTSHSDASDVSMSAYDLLPQEERDAIAWVRNHGGLDHVREEWRSRVPHDRYERRRQRLLDHIAECETALGRRREVISKLTHRVSDLTTENAELRRRAIPEGVKWPRYESGEPVGFGDEVSRLGEVFSISLYCDGSFALNFRAYSRGERVRRPAKVPDADGVPIREGDTVWDTDAETDTPLTVVEVSSDLVRCEYTWKDGKTYRPCYQPDQLTHTKPEPIDTWERLEEDLSKSYTEYWGCVDVICSRCPAEIDGKRPHERFDACSHDCILAMRHDLVRRARALAERGE